MGYVERINEILKEHLGLMEGQVIPEAGLIRDLGADSLDRLELMMKIEEEYGIWIEDEEAENLSTPKDLYNLVRKKVGDTELATQERYKKAHTSGILG